MLYGGPPYEKQLCGQELKKAHLHRFLPPLTFGNNWSLQLLNHYLTLTEVSLEGLSDCLTWLFPEAQTAFFFLPPVLPPTNKQCLLLQPDSDSRMPNTSTD